MLFRSIGYSDGYVEMSIDGGDFVRGNTRTFTGLNLNRKNFEVVVRIHDGKGKHGDYRLHVERTDEPILQIELQDLKMTDETAAGDGLYELKPKFTEGKGRYEAVISYTDRSVKITATAKNADDRISAVLPDGREIPLISGAESPDLVLPADFLADDNARAVIHLKVVEEFFLS